MQRMDESSPDLYREFQKITTRKLPKVKKSLWPNPKDYFLLLSFSFGIVKADTIAATNSTSTISNAVIFFFNLWVQFNTILSK